VIVAELTAHEVSEIAHLAMLSLSPEEAEQMRLELSAILDAMAVLAAVDTSGVVAMTHAMPMDLRLRADVHEPSLSVAVALAAAPSTADDLFVVPAVIGGD
jgi:aspartyl-tRNA(Asn)/glutamyl-tRNA(Gln) amidotransferase subunit C